jgi:hypothetical protein
MRSKENTFTFSKKLLIADSTRLGVRKSLWSIALSGRSIVQKTPGNHTKFYKEQQTRPSKNLSKIPPKTSDNTGETLEILKTRYE